MCTYYTLNSIEKTKPSAFYTVPSRRREIRAIFSCTGSTVLSQERGKKIKKFVIIVTRAWLRVLRGSRGLAQSRKTRDAGRPFRWVVGSWGWVSPEWETVRGCDGFSENKQPVTRERGVMPFFA